MKKIVFFVLVFVVLGCANDDESFGDLPYIKKWQENEPLCQDIATDCEISGDFSDDLMNILIQQWGKVIFETDEIASDRWKTSCQTIEDEYGDCEDFAVVAYRAIIDSCLSEYYEIDPRIRVVKTDGNKDYHVIAIVYYENLVYEIDQFFSVLETYDNIVLELDMEYIF